MTRKLNNILAFVGVLTLFITINAHAVTIDFEGLATGAITGTFSAVEDGFRMDMTDMYVDTNGNPGNEMEMLFLEETAEFLLSVDGGGLFQFDSIDLEGEGNEAATVLVEGFLGGVSVGIEMYDVEFEASYATFAASTLAGVTIDKLDIVAPRISFGTTALTSFDNIVVHEITSVPLPPALWLFSSGLLGLVGISRRKKVT